MQDKKEMNGGTVGLFKGEIIPEDLYILKHDTLCLMI